MATVYDLKKVLDTLIGSYKNADNFLVMTKLPGKKEPTSIVEFSVDDEQLYLSSDSEDNDVFTVSRLRNYITREAEECWKDDDNFMSTFYDCEIVIYDYDNEIVYDLSDIIIDKNQLLLICSNDEENDDEDDEEEIEENKEELIVSVTLSEAKLITEALNYFGDKVADSKGYLEGEKYWDLISKFLNE